MFFRKINNKTSDMLLKPFFFLALWKVPEKVLQVRLGRRFRERSRLSVPACCTVQMEVTGSDSDPAGAGARWMTGDLGPLPDYSGHPYHLHAQCSIWPLHPISSRRSDPHMPRHRKVNSFFSSRHEVRRLPTPSHIHRRSIRQLRDL